MGGEGFEPSKASLTDLQSAPFGHSGIHPVTKSISQKIKNAIGFSKRFAILFLKRYNKVTSYGV